MRTGGDSLKSRVVVAGGGGGQACCNNAAQGGAGGALHGAAGANGADEGSGRYGIVGGQGGKGGRQSRGVAVVKVVQPIPLIAQGQKVTTVRSATVGKAAHLVRLLRAVAVGADTTAVAVAAGVAESAASRTRTRHLAAAVAEVRPTLRQTQRFSKISKERLRPETVKLFSHGSRKRGEVVMNRILLIATTVALAALTGCGGSRAARSARRARCRKPSDYAREASSSYGDLLYVASSTYGIFVVTYPQGEVVDEFSLAPKRPESKCSGSQGAVFAHARRRWRRKHI